jgi:tetratricopeptide (TPR) repeat protein
LQSGEKNLARKKIRKKDLKKPDEFITFTSKILNWCRENIRIVMAAAGGIVVAVLLAGGVFVFQANREAKARALYDSALAFYPVESSGKTAEAQYAKVAAQLEELKQSFGSTTVVTSALIDLGNVYFQQGEYDKAISCYLDFLQRTDQKNPFHDQVLVSLGETQEAKGAWQPALEVYQRLVSEGTAVYQAQAQLYLGRVYEAMGDQKNAMTHYDNYLKENPATLYSEWIRTKLIRWRQAETIKEQG